MNLCNESVTIFNASFDSLTDADVYIGTVIKGVSWFGKIDTGVDGKGGLMAADSVVIRIPTDAVCAKSFVPAAIYTTPAGQWTLCPGAIIVRGEINMDSPTPKKLFAAYGDYCRTVLGFTDNRRAKAPHFKVVGR